MAFRIDGVWFSHPSGFSLEDVTLHVPAGRLSVLLGKNGSGKSTLLHLMAGLHRPMKGRIEVLGQDLAGLSTGARAKVIGYLPQFHSPVFPYTVEEVVLTGRAPYVFTVPRARDRDKAEEALLTVGMHDLRKRPYTELSGGERQLVMMARVLAQEPKVILLDEPVSHLDLSNQSRLLHLLKRLVAEGITVLAVLHDPNAAFGYGDDFFFIKQGRMQQPGPGQAPWDAGFLEGLFDTQLETVPYNGRALVIPKVTSPPRT
jgi:iron complex transport system ATP-binding protein